MIRQYVYPVVATVGLAAATILAAMYALSGFHAGLKALGFEEREAVLANLVLFYVIAAAVGRAAYLFWTSPSPAQASGSRKTESRDEA